LYLKPRGFELKSLLERRGVRDHRREELTWKWLNLSESPARPGITSRNSTIRRSARSSLLPRVLEGLDLLATGFFDRGEALLNVHLPSISFPLAEPHEHREEQGAYPRYATDSIPKCARCEDRHLRIHIADHLEALSGGRPT
jgi:hypothetical protein